MGLFSKFLGKPEKLQNNAISPVEKQGSLRFDYLQTNEPVEKIALLLKGRCIKENLSKQDWLKASSAIEYEMGNYVFMPFQVCNCFYIGEGKAWTSYNLNNKRALSLAINEINYHLSTLRELEPEQDAIPKIVPLDYNIKFGTICFDYSSVVRAGDFPRSYIVYAPKTKTGKRSQYPLIAFFNTIKNSENDNGGENYCGELYYSITGDLSKATVHCWKHGKFTEFNFSVVGRTFLISSIKTVDENGRMFSVYDCNWKFTDYADFSG